MTYQPLTLSALVGKGLLVGVFLALVSGAFLLVYRITFWSSP